MFLRGYIRKFSIEPNISTTHHLVLWLWEHLIGAIAKLALSLLWPDSPSISDYPSNKNGMTPRLVAQLPLEWGTGVWAAGAV